MPRLGALHGNDFKHLWLGAWLLAADRNPYDPAWLFRAARNFNLGAINPYVYLPTTGLMLRPLAALPFSLAMLVWHWFNWALAWVVVLWGPALLRAPRPALARLAGALLLASPALAFLPLGSVVFFRQQTAGQMNVVTVALIVGAAAALMRGKAFWTGLFLGVGFAWKIAPALLIAALGPLRRWRALAWGCAISLALLGVSVMVYGWPVHRAALPVLGQMGYGQSTWAEFGNDFYRDPYNQSPNSLMHHLLTKNPYTKPWVEASPTLANRLTMVVSLILAGLWLVQAWRRVWISPQFPIRNAQLKAAGQAGEDARAPGDIPQSVPPLFFAATLAMLLLPSLMWDHYAVQALPALLWVFGSAAVGRSAWRATLAFLILALIVAPWIHVAPAWTHGAGILLMSMRLWPVLGLYLWLLFDRGLEGEA